VEVLQHAIKNKKNNKKQKRDMVLREFASRLRKTPFFTYAGDLSMGGTILWHMVIFFDIKLH
jgi:hypothetical protein